MGSKYVHIWDNAAFDNEEVENERISCVSLMSTFGNYKGSFESGKENQGSFSESQISSNSSSEEISVLRGNDDKESRDGRDMEKEIEEIESDISRLNSRLKALRLEKRGRNVPAKFMEQKQCMKNMEKRKINEASDSSAGTKFQRRGVSLGPAEIASSVQRGMSTNLKMGRQDIIIPVQSGRMFCFLKLEETEEEKGMGNGSSLSPKSRKVASKTQVLPRQAGAAVAFRKGVKKDERMTLSSVQPKKLLKEEQLVDKKPSRRGRVVASRYYQHTNQALSIKKRSLMENDKENSKRCEKQRSLSVGKSGESENESKNLGTVTRVKKQWKIPREIVIHNSHEGESSGC